MRTETLVIEVLRMAGVLRPGEVPSAEQYEHVITLLDYLTEFWSGEPQSSANDNEDLGAE